ncbi:MAG: hypothetical protein CFE41_01080 [Burkholderiales bacterium PBB2]|nr:DoxX family protein [Roseateles sp.]OYU29522.1 MAG: hypothetical protein CFE41_01080 [Burkholderiales bacterium PBB2]
MSIQLPVLPCLSLRQALWVLRLGIPALFMAHAVTRIFNGTIPRFAGYLSQFSFLPEPLLWVWAITATEIIAGSCLMLGIAMRWAAAALAVIALGGMALIHVHRGWFVGEHGSGGVEYSVCLLLGLLVLAAADREFVRKPPSPTLEA